jgi:mycothiol synthase
MVQVRVLRSLSAEEYASTSAFLDAAYAAGNARLNDHLTSDRVHGERDGFRAAIATSDADVVGYAQASAANNGVVVGVVSADQHTAALLLRELLSVVPTTKAVTWWSTDASAAIAHDLGMSPARRLFRMGRRLPIGDATDVALRPFRVGQDEEAWLQVNNAAFALHGEQGGWDLATLQQRELEPWFSADGFLLHERDGRLAAFCWTKLHPGGTLVGEIYVIAVHPDFHGHGLGRALTVAGLQHLGAAGAQAAMLYVDAANEAAVGLYRSLGFEVEFTDQSYVRSSSDSRPRSDQGALT